MVKVGIVMGSDSDLSVMEKAAQVLDELSIKWEMNIISAHRTPDQAQEYASLAAERGLKVIIAGAGLAAHLAGVIAAHTSLVVIGVPLASGSLKGQDALLSTVQMPPGIPVATVGIDGARNAGILAAQILSLNDQEIANSLKEFKKQMTAKVLDKNKALQNKLKK